jgi:hypothetical protein
MDSIRIYRGQAFPDIFTLSVSILTTHVKKPCHNPTAGME